MKFEELTQKVKKFSRDTVEEVQKMNEVRQLNGKVNDAKKQIENIYTEIGKKFFDLNKDYAPEGFEEYIQTINDKLAQIEQLKEQVRDVKGVVLCTKCNSEVPLTERFCSNCGNKMPEVIEIVDEEDESAVVVDAEDVTEVAEDAAGGIKEAAEDVVEDVKEAAKDVAEDVKEAVKDVAEDVKEAADDVVEDVKEAAENVAEDME